MTSLNIMVLPKSKDNMDSLNKYYNNFQKGHLNLDETANLIKSLESKEQKIYLLERRVTQMENSQR